MVMDHDEINPDTTIPPSICFFACQRDTFQRGRRNMLTRWACLCVLCVNVFVCVCACARATRFRISHNQLLQVAQAQAAQAKLTLHLRGRRIGGYCKRVSRSATAIRNLQIPTQPSQQLENGNRGTSFQHLVSLLAAWYDLVAIHARVNSSTSSPVVPSIRILAHNGHMQVSEMICNHTHSQTLTHLHLDNPATSKHGHPQHCIASLLSLIHI